MRFNEFNKPWDKYKLKDISKRITRKNINNTSKLPLTISAQFGLINQEEFFDKQIASRDMSNYYLIQNGEFAYNKSYSNGYPWGAIKRLDKYDNGALSTLYICFKPKDNICSDYLTHYFETTKWYKGISDIAGEGARNHGLLNMSVDDFFDTKHYLPDIQEQVKIKDFLNLISRKVNTQSKIIEEYESLISRIRKTIFSKLNCEWGKLNNLIEKGFISLYRGNIIHKHEKDDTHIYPVYSSSVQKDGLMGYSDNFMFDEELITWSIDGGGDIFYRHKHKFSVTNVCGIMKVDTHYYNYRFVSEILKDEHSRMVFDYQTKAHPSVINKLYSLPQISIEEQLKISKVFDCLYSKLAVEKELLKKLKEQKKYLLSNMFI